VTKDLPALPEPRALLDRKDQKDAKETKAPLATKDRKVIQERTERTVRTARTVNLAFKGPPESKVFKGLKVLRVQQVSKVRKVLWVLPGPRVQSDNVVLTEKKAPAENPAPTVNAAHGSETTPDNILSLTSQSASLL
jgi:hypothetical protein